MKRATHKRATGRQSAAETSAIQLIEEAFHLLRSAPGQTLWWFFLGTVPFACLLFYFWADMSRSSYAQEDAALTALLLCLAFFWKCSLQARFCRSLWETINPGFTPKQTGWQRFRYHAAIWLFQAFSFPLLLLGTCFVLPLAWVASTFQNGYVLGLTQEFGKQPLRNLVIRSIRNSHYEWAQNHSVWITLGFLALFGWVNIYVAMTLPPQLLKMFLGVETAFSTNPGSLINSTFIFGTILVTYLIMSPLAKAVFVLRCFYSESRTTGADLLSRLSSLRRSRAGRGEVRSRVSRFGAAVVAPVVLAAAGAPGVSSAQQVAGYNPESLDSAIQETMMAKKYQWKFSRKLLEGEVDEETGWMDKQIEMLTESFETKMRQFQEWMKERANSFIEDWLKRMDGREAPARRTLDNDFARGLHSTLSVFLVVLVTLLVGWLVYLVARHYRNSPRLEAEETGDLAKEIDLESEEIVADQLPEDEWIKLAREQIAKGEARLAIRALFLATLAHLGERGLLKIERYKSNLDYRRELALRARREEALRAAFSENSGVFERAWYGLHPIANESVDHFLENYQTITGGETA